MGNKLCPRCDTEMLLLFDDDKNDYEYECPVDFGGCGYREPLPIDQKLRLQGAATLPGID